MKNNYDLTLQNNLLRLFTIVVDVDVPPRLFGTNMLKVHKFEQIRVINPAIQE